MDSVTTALTAALTQAKSISSGSMSSGSLSAVTVAVSYGFGYDRNMLDAGYMPEKLVSVLAATSDISSWTIVPRQTKVNLTAQTISGSFLIQNVSQQNPVVSYLILGVVA